MLSHRLHTVCLPLTRSQYLSVSKSLNTTWTRDSEGTLLKRPGALLGPVDAQWATKDRIRVWHFYLHFVSVCDTVLKNFRSDSCSTLHIDIITM